MEGERGVDHGIDISEARGKGLREEYHAACGPYDTISPQRARFNFKLRRRADCVRKPNGASKFKVGDSARTRERRSE